METLCRVTTNGYFIDEDGFLLTHQTRFEYAQYKDREPPKNPGPVVLTKDMRPLLPLVPSHDNRMLPLVHPDEWETAARFMFARFWLRPVRLLTVDKTRIRDLINTPHPALFYGEFFGKVHKEAVVSDEEYRWAEGRCTNLSDLGKIFISERFPLDVHLMTEKYGLEKVAS